MCDTLILHDNRGKPFLFGKNSDRHPEEPQALVYIPPHEPKNVQVREGIEYSDKGYAFLLSKPSWINGGEMGLNSKGLAIGNEAVFSRFKPDKNGVLGMDILRAALSACATSEEALDFIISFIERFPQGGNGAYKGKLFYNNSFLIADPEKAYILETAGARWAWRKAMIADAISNIYCIEDDYEHLDTTTGMEIAQANNQAARPNETDPSQKEQLASWKKYVEDKKYLLFTQGEQRRSTSLSSLMRIAAGSDKTEQGQVLSSSAIEPFFAILRSHEGAPKPGAFLNRMKNVCIHPGIFPKSATTASMAVEYCSGGAIIWYTDSSYPCISLYKPALLKDGRFYALWKSLLEENIAEKSYTYWGKRKDWASQPHKLALSSQQSFVQSRDAGQKSIVAIAHQALSSMIKEKTTPERMLSVYASEVAAIVGEWEEHWRY
jgi:hypothetical protein